MRNEGTPSAWDLMERGEFELALAKMSREMAQDPTITQRHIHNRGLCLLNLDRPADALASFKKSIRLRPDTDAGFIHAGIALWWLGRESKAVDTWRNGMGTKYTDAAGGVEVPALLYFAGVRLGDPGLEREAIAALRKRWRTKRATAWPGPIAGFILNKLDVDGFMAAGGHRHPILQRRQLTQKQFWIGVSYYRRGDLGKYRRYMQLASRGTLLESEYYLAKYELRRLGDELADSFPWWRRWLGGGAMGTR